MCFSQKLTLVAGAILLCAAVGISSAQAPPPAGGTPPPGGMMPPPLDPAVFEQVFKMIDTNKDGVLQPEEVKAWARHAHAPGPTGPAGLMLMQPGFAGPPPGGPPPGGPPPGGPPPGGMPPGGPPPGGMPPGGTPPPGGMPPGGMPPAGKPGEIPEPPPCSDALRTSEQNPQKTGVPCNGKEGNLLFRTVCNMKGYDTQAIVLPAGRAAGCFGVEAITHNKVVFGIRIEGGPDIYRSTMGPGPLMGLIITDVAPSAAGKYTVYIDMAASDPGARVTVRFVDYPK